MKNIKGKLEVAANLSIIAVAILLCVVLVQSYVIPAPALQPVRESVESRKGIKRGDTVTVSGIDWQKNGKTLLLVLSSSCGFCTSSAPFYRRLTKVIDAHTIAVLPQPVSEGRAYLERLGVSVSEVRQEAPTALGVTGTPTLILVNESGVVTTSWVGKLSPAQEDDVLSQMQLSRVGH